MSRRARPAPRSRGDDEEMAQLQQLWRQLNPSGTGQVKIEDVQRMAKKLNIKIDVPESVARPTSSFQSPTAPSTSASTSKAANTSDAATTRPGPRVSFKQLQEDARAAGCSSREVAMALDARELRQLIARAREHTAPPTKTIEPQVSTPRCWVCNSVTPTDPDDSRYYVYLETPFWGDKYCHSHKGMVGCASCERMPSVFDDTNFMPIGDGLLLCCRCNQMASYDFEAFSAGVCDFFGELSGAGANSVPISQVTLNTLNSRASAMCKPIKTRRGLCVAKQDSRGRVVEVTGVMVLAGLPRLVAGSVLAHELTHAHIKQNFPLAKLPLQVEEGLCQLSSALWLEACDGAQSADESKLKEYLTFKIQNHADPVYGTGYSLARKAYEANGRDFVGLVEHVCRTREFMAI